MADTQRLEALDAVDTLGTPDSQYAVDQLDRQLRRYLARFTRGASPISLGTAWFDWASHMAISPGLRARLLVHAHTQALREGSEQLAKVREGESLTKAALDRLERLQHSYEQWADWLEREVARPTGVSRRHGDLVAFTLRQFTEAWHPRNFFWSNPEALRATFEESAANLARGSVHFWEDLSETLLGPSARKPHLPDGLGETIAATPGSVVYRNALIELIHYRPKQALVHRQPVLITPAWIMKYYILDLNPESSLVGYLLDQGFDVFMISWRNPGEGDRDLGFDDYRRLGVGAALDAIADLVPDTQVHGVGYCLGGTLLAVAAAALSGTGERRFASLSLFASQVDFSDPGELSVYIDEAQLAALEAGMDGPGYLGGDQMAAAFSLLRARDLIWRRLHQDYYLGQRDEQIDLMAWNKDTTRMPYRMHSEYLRHFFLNNDFIEGRYRVEGRSVAVSDIRAPIFALGTTRDHVAPWRSVFKLHLFADTDVTFTLTSGGHNAGIVSPPGHPRRKHWIATRHDCEAFIDPDRWTELADLREGSWWPSWANWLAERSEGMRKATSPARAAVASNLIGAAVGLDPAPGTYVKQ